MAAEDWYSDTVERQMGDDASYESDGVYWGRLLEERYEQEYEQEQDDEISNLVYFSNKAKRGNTKMTEKTESIVENAIKLGETTLEELKQENPILSAPLNEQAFSRGQRENTEGKTTVSPPFLANGPSDHQGMMITLYGEPGAGKSTLAAALCEGKKTLVAAIESIKAYKNKSWIDFTKTITRYSSIITVAEWLLNNNHDYTAFIVESISKLDEIISVEVLGEDPKKNESLNKAHGGYGAGVDIVKNRHRELKKLFDRLANEKSMLIVFVAHVTEHEKTISSSAEEFIYSDISINKRYSDIYTYYVDVVAKIYPRFFVNKGRITTSDDKVRIFDCVTNAAQCSKNNLGIDKAIEFGIDENPLKGYL